MTNFQSFAGSLLWAAIAGVLMLATFEPAGSAAEAQQSAGASEAARQTAL